MADPTIEPTPISQMAQVSVPPSGTSLVPAIIWNPDKLGPGVGGWESKAVPVSLLLASSVNTILSGNGIPTTSIGKDGDFYIDLDAWHIYGPKVLGSWPPGTQLSPPVDAALAVMSQVTMLAGFAGKAAQVAHRTQSIADQVVTRVYSLIQMTQRSSIRARAAASQAQAVVAGQAAFFAEAARARRKFQSLSATLGDDQIALKSQFFS